ncbi:MAG: ATP-binding protein [Nannocystaceae bacterium]
MDSGLVGRLREMERSLLAVLGGERTLLMRVTEEQDELDAVATGINILVEELRYEVGEQARLRRETNHVFRALTNPLAVLGEDGVVLRCNPALCELTGYSEQRLRGVPLDMLYADRSAAKRFLADVRAVGSCSETETQCKVADGRIVSVLVTGAMLPEDAGCGFVWVARDLTELRTLLLKAASAKQDRARADVLEEARDRLVKTLDELRQTQVQLIEAQKMEAIGRFAGGLAHDFNNLLMVIMGCTESLALLTGRDGKVGTELADIEAAAERASHLTRKLLTVSRRHPSQPCVTDINEIVRGASRMLRRLVGEDVELVFLLDPEPWLIRIDPGHLEQVVVNLAINARDAMAEGGKLTFRTGKGSVSSVSSGDLPTEHVVLTVEDTGLGMSADVQARVFEPFFTTKSPDRGTGLGLSSCYGIVAQAKGHMVVHSELGRGSRFEVHLPRVVGELSGKNIFADAVACRDNLNVGGDERLLVVEDEPVVRSIIVRTLERLGYEVRSASNGSEALSMCDNGELGDFALLITDIVMPHLGGAELARRLRESRTDLPTLYISGYADRYPDELGGAGNSTLLCKPFLPHELARRVRSMIDQSASFESGVGEGSERDTKSL